MRIIFAGTPQTAVPTLQALLASDHQVVAVLTRPPARQGRGRTLVDSPVSTLAKERGVQVIETTRPRDPEVQARLKESAPDLGVVVAYGAILPGSVLTIPRHGWVNLHFSDLPRWRGAAPVQHAIRARDAHTAACVFQLEEGLDTGPVFARLPVDLDGTETTDSLLASMAEAGAASVVSVANAIEAGTAGAIPQSLDGLTIARRLSKNDAYVDFQQTALDTDARIRSVTSNPGAWTVINGQTVLRLGPARPLPEASSPGEGRVIADKRSVRVGCAKGVIELGRVAPAGKGWMDAAAWWRGARLEEDVILGGNRG